MSGGLARDPRRAASSSYDLVVVGGGIHGVAATLEAARRGLSVLLLERDDFGGATTWNSLRIVHGGLRYLQSLDLRRFRESVGERRWLLEHFPDLVEPLPCLMPLYGPPRGGRLRRRTPFRVAMALNDRLAPDPTLEPGRLLDARETAELCPAVDREGLRGGALWHDAVTPDSQRLLVEMLRWACDRGAVALNYVEAAELRVEAGRVAGVRALDRASGERLDVDARAVLNCAGPWARRVAQRFHHDLPALAQPVLGFNLFLDVRAEALLRGRTALAVAAPGPGAQTWFLLPWKERILAGTAYVTGAGEAGESGPDDAAVEGFLRELNAALPALGGLTGARSQVLRVHWGWLSAADRQPGGSVAPGSRPVIHDHRRDGGPAGLVSLSGVKLTTARALAERALATLFPGLPQPTPAARPAADPPLPWEGFARLAEDDWNAARSWLAGFTERQAVVELDDLLLRRTDWGVIPERAALAERLCRSLLLGRPRGGRAAAPSAGTEGAEALMAGAGRGRR